MQSNGQEKIVITLWMIFDDVYLEHWPAFLTENFWPIITVVNVKWIFIGKALLMDLLPGRLVQLIINLLIKMKIDKCWRGYNVAKLWHLLLFWVSAYPI